MEKINTIGYSLKDVAIVQETVSRFSSRSQVIPFVKTCKKETLPIFVSPMDSVTDENNYKIWQNNKLTPVIPRTVQKRLSLRDRLILGRECFISLSLNETEKLFKMVKEDTVLMYLSEECPLYICIDIAHGTMSKLLDLCKDIKSKYGQRVIIMTGNIANPEAYKLYCKAHIDYVRCAIGGGSRCTTSVNVGIHYPMASLLDKICHYKRCMLAENSYNKFPITDPRHNFVTKVVADGGISWFDDINKALAIGADYVMCGKMFAECEEACGEIGWAKDINEMMDGNYITNDDYNVLVKDEYKSLLKPFRMYKGMSTRDAQKGMGGNGTKTSEGISKAVEVKYPVSKLVNNIESYLRSAMSYTNSETIEEFNNSEIVVLGGNSYNSFVK